LHHISLGWKALKSQKENYVLRYKKERNLYNQVMTYNTYISELKKIKDSDKLWSWDSVAGIATGYRLDDQEVGV
jgi:hypothetical protein